MTLGGSSHDLDVYSVAQRLCVAVVPSTVARMGVHIESSREEINQKPVVMCTPFQLNFKFKTPICLFSLPVFRYLLKSDSIDITVTGVLLHSDA